MRSGQLARQAGVSTDTLRHYERLGLLPLPQRTAGNYREYPLASAQRVELIQRALMIGFSLAELKTILAVRDKGGAPCRRVRNLLRSKIRNLDQQIKNLVSLRAEMNRLSRDWDTRLRRTRSGQAARLLESVPPRPRTRGISGRPTFRKRKGLWIMRTMPLLFLLAILAGMASAQQNPPPDQDRRSEDVVKRGEHVMGFSHEATAHHFRLFKDGGEIAVQAKDPDDKASIEQIRTHLGHIAKMFSFGNFNAPMLIHDTNPPGVATMTRLKGRIRYEFSATERGARIRLITASPEITDAVHAFLLFQIVDHQTGDAPTISDELSKK
jgi:DNA-binding transcriptional MerR regulator